MSTRKGSLAGKRVYLRRPRPRDAAEFIALNRASMQFHHGLVSPPVSPSQFSEFLKRSGQSNADCFLIFRVSDDRILGTINLSQIFMGGFRSAYLGYYLGAPHAQQGYMTEALQLVLQHAFRQLKLNRLEANVQPGNVGSIALIERAGFVREGYSRRYLKIGGRWRDHERWAILNQDWRPSQANQA